MDIFLQFTTNPPIPKKFYSYLDYICDTIDSAVSDGSALIRKYDMDTSPQIETLNLDIKMHSSAAGLTFLPNVPKSNRQRLPDHGFTGPPGLKGWVQQCFPSRGLKEYLRFEVTYDGDIQTSAPSFG